MKCPECKTELWLDHVKITEGTTRYFYICPNKTCQNAKLALSPTGEIETAKIARGGENGRT